MNNQKQYNMINFLKVIAMYLVVMVHAGNIFSYANGGEEVRRCLKAFTILSGMGVPIFFAYPAIYCFVKNIHGKRI